MKPLLAAALLAAGPLLSGCAEDGTPPAEDVREHFERGAAGEGTLGPIDRQDDPHMNPREGAPNAGHP